MKPAKKVACIVGAALLLLGALVFGLALLLGARPQDLWTGGLPEVPSWISLGSSSAQAPPLETSSGSLELLYWD